jgi:hypothetical protein
LVSYPCAIVAVLETVHRTARIRVAVTPGQARRCFGLLVAAGDVWAGLIVVNEARFRRGAHPIGNYQEWCREIAGVEAGELSVTAMRSGLRREASARAELRGSARKPS